MPRGENNRKLSDDDRIEVVRRYTTPLPDGTWEGSKILGKDFGVHPNTVAYILQRSGITIRSAKESHAHGKRCGPFKHIAQIEEPPLCACGCGTPAHWVRGKYQWSKYAHGHYRKNKPYKEERWLREQYEAMRRSAIEIAVECGVNQTTVIRAMEGFGIKRRDAREAHKGTQAGSNNPAWKGGVTPERQRLCKTTEWKDLIKAIYKRDDYRCQRCQQGITGSKRDREPCAHHIKSWAEYPDLRREPTNLITLCRECHVWVHSLENINRDFIG